tara:strand:- start:2941 stop:3642 length:702 start_codon:yes stop_codon:yes gene_type:complete
MSYLGFIKPLSRYFLTQFQFPKVLEIGVDRGQSALPLISNLSRFEKFAYVGIDIKIDKNLHEQFIQMDHVNYVNWTHELCERDVYYIEGNSLSTLPKLGTGTKYDLIMIDGDHNYETVSQELDFIKPLMEPWTIILCDDYNGRWAFKDLYYAERNNTKDLELATPRETCSPIEGVRPAVDEWLEQNVEWGKLNILNSDPVFLFRKDFWDIKYEISPKGFAELKVILKRVNNVK